MEKKVYEVYCNSCGKKIETTDSTKREDYISIKKEWGYFAGEQNALWKKFNKGVKKMGRVYEQLINLLKKRKDSVKIRNRVNLDKLRSRSWVY